MCSFKSIYFVIFILNLYKTNAQISDKRLCVDPECKEPVSLAKTLLRYSSLEPSVLSFAPNAEVRIFSKEAGSVTNLWGAEINGKRGYVPKHLVREYKILKKPTELVDTELKQKPQVPIEARDAVEPNKAEKPFEIVDGTTIYLNSHDGISPSTTESPVLATAVPPASHLAVDKTETLKDSKEEAVLTDLNAEKSILENGISQWSNFLGDDANAEELDEGDGDEEEDDEEEEDEEIVEDDKEGKLKLDNETVTNSEQQDIKLTSELKITTFSVKMEQPVKKKVDVVQESALVPEEVKTPIPNVAVAPESNPVPKVEVQAPEENLTNPYVTHFQLEEDGKVALEPLTQSSVGEDEALPILEAVTPNPGKHKEEADTIASMSLLQTAASLEENKTPPAQSASLPTSTTSNIQIPSNAIIEEDLHKLSESLKRENASYQTEDIPKPSMSEKKDMAEPAADTVNVKIPEEEISQPNVIPVQIAAPKEEITKEEEKLSAQFNPYPPLGSHFKKVDNVQKENMEEGNSMEQLVDIEQAKDEEAAAEEDSTSTVSDEEIVKDTKNEETVNPVETFEDVLGEVNSPNEIQLDNQEVQNDSNEELSIAEEAVELPSEEAVEESGSFLSGLYSMFGGASDSSPNDEIVWSPQHEENAAAHLGYCDSDSENCNVSQQEEPVNHKRVVDDLNFSISSDVILLLTITAASVILLLFGFLALDRNGREGPLVAKINKLEKELLITLKENELLQEKSADVLDGESMPKEQLVELQLIRQALEERLMQLEKEVEEKEGLEEQIEVLEKELETSTEVGMELNRIISEMLDPTNGSDKLKENVEQLQRQLLEQKDTINNINDTLRDKEAENKRLQVEVEQNKTKAAELQGKLDDTVEKVVRITRERDQQQRTLQNEVDVYRQKYNEAVGKEDILNNEIQVLRLQLSEIRRQADVKSNEYQLLTDSLNKIKSIKNDSSALNSLLETTSVKAELQQLKSENAAYAEQFQQEQAVKAAFEKKYQVIMEQVNSLQCQYEQADKEKVEVNSKLEVLNNYFKKRETELQEEVIKYKSIWDAKEGEATSTTERMKYMQEEIENYKAHNETLKQEIISQEIDLKSKISMLEKKVHENWVTARQTDRKLEDARQEAAQLRNRLTLRERAINEERIQNRLQSVEQNGDMPLSPHLIDSPASPPLMYGDHITKSPPIPGMPPFLPPPPGAPFMPPPLHGMPSFIPPPPSMYPGDHRPPPLGRMSSPPLNSRYSPDTLAFSPYGRHSPSPLYDSEYGVSPPPLRSYSPYNSRDDRRDYKRPPHARTNGRNMKGSAMSSGSDHSNDSLDKINRKQSKMI